MCSREANLGWLACTHRDLSLETSVDCNEPQRDTRRRGARVNWWEIAVHRRGKRQTKNYLGRHLVRSSAAHRASPVVVAHSKPTRNRIQLLWAQPTDSNAGGGGNEFVVRSLDLSRIEGASVLSEDLIKNTDDLRAFNICLQDIATCSYVRITPRVCLQQQLLPVPQRCPPTHHSQLSFALLEKPVHTWRDTEVLLEREACGTALARSAATLAKCFARSSLIFCDRWTLFL